MHCACTKRPYFHFRSKIWRHRRVPRPRFSLRRGNFGNSAINILHNFYCACAKRPYFHFRSKIWRHCRVSWPRFPSRTRKFCHFDHRVILHIFQFACLKRPYFHFLSKIWRHHRVPRPQFPFRCENFASSRFISICQHPLFSTDCIKWPFIIFAVAFVQAVHF